MGFDPNTILLFAIAALLAYAVWTARRHRAEIEGLRSEIDGLEGHTRRLTNERDALNQKLAESRAALDQMRQRVNTLETEKQELESRRDALEQTAARLEKARAELESALGALRTRHAELENRVVGFQGAWTRQLDTLEEEISTLVRQIGEFRKGTPLPLSENLPGTVSGKETVPGPLMRR